VNEREVYVVDGKKRFRGGCTDAEALRECKAVSVSLPIEEEPKETK
jgi:hypothetical protein